MRNHRRNVARAHAFREQSFGCLRKPGPGRAQGRHIEQKEQYGWMLLVALLCLVADTVLTRRALLRAELDSEGQQVSAGLPEPGAAGALGSRGLIEAEESTGRKSRRRAAAGRVAAGSGEAA